LAVKHAIGCQVRQLPLTPQRILGLLDAKERGAA
jgi:CO/xanthine dehydrogenase Mo-binding subunit